jgi:hypothetical protein
VLTDESRGGLRAIGGLVLATGALVLLFRRSGLGDPWGSGPIFLILLATASFLYGSGFLGARWVGRVLPWQGAFVVFGILLVPLTLFAFVDWVGGSTGSSLNAAWIFSLTAVSGFAAARLAGVGYGALLGSLALIVAWLTLWDGVLSDGLDSVNTVRWLLLAIAVGLLALATAASLFGGDDWAGDVITGAGAAAVGAGALVAAVLTFGGSFIIAAQSADFGGANDFIVRQSWFWDLELLVVSLALITYAGVSRVRGPAYVGGVGLVLFIYSVGLDLDDRSPAGKVFGWPLILLLVGAALFAASVLPALRGDRS